MATHGLHHVPLRTTPFPLPVDNYPCNTPRGFVERDYHLFIPMTLWKQFPTAMNQMRARPQNNERQQEVIDARQQLEVFVEAFRMPKMEQPRYGVVRTECIEKVAGEAPAAAAMEGVVEVAPAAAPNRDMNSEMDSDDETVMDPNEAVAGPSGAATAPPPRIQHPSTPESDNRTTTTKKTTKTGNKRKSAIEEFDEDGQVVKKLKVMPVPHYYTFYEDENRKVLPRFQFVLEALFKDDQHAEDNVANLFAEDNIAGIGIHIYVYDPKLTVQLALANLLRVNRRSPIPKNLRHKYTTDDDAMGFTTGYSDITSVQDLAALYSENGAIIADSAHMSLTAMQQEITDAELDQRFELTTYLKMLVEWNVCDAQVNHCVTTSFAIPEAALSINVVELTDKFYTKEFFWSTIRRQIMDTIPHPIPLADLTQRVMTTAWRRKVMRAAKGHYAVSASIMEPKPGQHEFQHQGDLNEKEFTELTEENQRRANDPSRWLEVQHWQDLKAARVLASFDAERQLPDSVLAAIDWYEREQPKSYRRLDDKYKDLSPFGNMMLHRWAQFSTVLSVGGLVWPCIRLLQASFTIFKDGFGARTHPVLVGPPGTGKSEMRNRTLGLLLPGSHQCVSASSAKSGLGEDDIFQRTNLMRYYDEAFAAVTTSNNKRSSENEQFLRNMLQTLSRQRMTVERLIQNPQTNRQFTAVTEVQQAVVVTMCSNHHISDPALRDRLLTMEIMATSGMHGASLVQLVNSTTFAKDSKLVKEYGLFMQTKAYHILLYQKLICSNVFPATDSSMVHLVSSIQSKRLTASISGVRVRAIQGDTTVYDEQMLDYGEHMVFSSVLSPLIETVCVAGEWIRESKPLEPWHFREMMRYMGPNFEIAVAAVKQNQQQHIDNATMDILLAFVEVLCGLPSKLLIEYVLYANQMANVDSYVEYHKWACHEYPDIPAVQWPAHHERIYNPVSIEQDNFFFHPDIPEGWRPEEQELFIHSGKYHYYAPEGTPVKAPVDILDAALTQFARRRPRIPKRPYYTFITAPELPAGAATGEAATERRAENGYRARGGVKFRVINRNINAAAGAAFQPIRLDMNYMEVEGVKTIKDMETKIGKVLHAHTIRYNADIHGKIPAIAEIPKFDADTVNRVLKSVMDEPLLAPKWHYQSTTVNEYQLAKLLLPGNIPGQTGSEMFIEEDGKVYCNGLAMVMRALRNCRLEKQFYTDIACQYTREQTLMLNVPMENKCYLPRIHHIKPIAGQEIRVPNVKFIDPVLKDLMECSSGTMQIDEQRLHPEFVFDKDPEEHFYDIYGINNGFDPTEYKPKRIKERIEAMYLNKDWLQKMDQRRRQDGGYKYPDDFQHL